MSNPQQPELRRSERGAFDQNSAAAEVQDVDVEAAPSAGPVPEDNLPGHHPEREQDKPDPQAFAEAFGIARDDDEVE